MDPRGNDSRPSPIERKHTGPDPWVRGGDAHPVSTPPEFAVSPFGVFPVAESVLNAARSPMTILPPLKRRASVVGTVRDSPVSVDEASSSRRDLRTERESALLPSETIMGHKKDVGTTGSIVSADGTRIGYRRLGQGPSVILLHGGVNASQHMMKLGRALADAFMVYLPDRRGRGDEWRLRARLQHPARG